jgi:hypothetical protein
MPRVVVEAGISDHRGDVADLAAYVTQSLRS